MQFNEKNVDTFEDFCHHPALDFLFEPQKNSFGINSIKDYYSALNFLSDSCNFILPGCSSDITSSNFFRPSKVTELVTLRVSEGEFKKKLNLNPNPYLLLPSIVFHNKICVFIIIFTALSFLRHIHGLFII